MDVVRHHAGREEIVALLVEINDCGQGNHARFLGQDTVLACRECDVINSMRALVVG